jgi:hypothetical protein
VNLEEYISSGLIESCVLGLASPEELEEFEKMCASHEVVREARKRFELSLEMQLLESTAKPPVELKERVLNGLENSGLKPSRGNHAPKAQALTPLPGSVWLRYAAAACLVLLLGSTGLNIYFFTQYKAYIFKYDQLLGSQTQMLQASQAMQTKLGDYQASLDLMRDPSMTVVKMPGTAPHPGSLTTVYWDSRSKDVYLLINQLPQPAADKQYQLWALVDGRPVDAGVFDLDSPSLVKMKNIPLAQAFAVTLEKRGGSNKPTMEAMYVMGKVAG